MTMLIDEDVYLEHYGVKGMKWGVRRDRRLARIEAVGRGEGSRLDKIRVGANLPGKDIIRGRGFQGGAKIKGERMRARSDRIKNNEGKIRDHLIQKGSARLIDVVPTRTSKASREAQKKAYNKLEKAVLDRMAEQKRTGVKPSRAENKAFSDKVNAELARELRAAYDL